MRSFKEKITTTVVPLSGAWVASNSSYATEIMSMAGFDVLIIDCEHTAIDFSDIHRHVQAAHSCRNDIGVFVRVPEIDKSFVKRVLDIGIAGIIFPNTETKENVHDIINCCFYPPIGCRGISTSMTRASKFGLNKEYINNANDTLILTVQIESKKAIENIEEIMSFQEIDMIFVGKKDLSMDMGIFGNYLDESLIQAIKGIESLAKNNGKLLATSIAYKNEEKELVNKGYSLITIGSDVSILSKYSKMLVETFNNISKGDLNNVT